MKKDVVITVKGLQAYGGNTDSDIELVTLGRFYHKDGSYYVTYNESEMTGLGKTTTTLKIEDKRVTVIRFGEAQTHMVFELGKKHLSYYDVGVGSLTVGVSTRSILKSINDAGGVIKVDYSMEINNSLTGENELEINIREAGIPS